jgi:hypothetical protein
MTILDTNVVSALMNEPAEQQVVSWLDRQVQSSIWTTSITVLEIHTGLQLMQAGKRRSKLTEVFESFLDDIDHRVAVLDEESARLAANLTAQRRKSGRSGELRDTLIAGIVMARHATFATRNVSHFSDISTAVVNPWAV